MTFAQRIAGATVLGAVMLLGSDRLLTGAGLGASPIREAEKALRRAEAEYDALRKVEGPLREHMASAESDLTWARRHVRERATEVLATAPAVGKLLDRVEELQRELVESGDHLLLLIGEGVLKPVGGIAFNPAVNDIPTRCRRLAQRLRVPPVEWTELLLEKPDTWKVWSNTLEELQADASAKLPE